MLFLRRKKKTPQPLDEKRMRQIINEELDAHDTNLKDISDKEKKREIVMKRIMAMPKNKRRKFLNYLSRREGVKHGKK